MIGLQPITANPLSPDEEGLFGNFCLFCGSDSLPEEAYCSSICELQDLQSSSDQKYIVPALTSGSTSTGSGSSICSTPPSSPEKSPAQALGTVDELTADIGSFRLPPSLMKAKPLPSKNLNFNYGIANTPVESSIDDISPPSPIMLGQPYGKKLVKSTSSQGRSLDAGSPTTPTETLLRLQRNQSQLPAAPRRESRGLMSPQLKATLPSSFDNTFAKKTAVRISQSNLSNAARACGKPGCDSLHQHSRPIPPKFDTRRPSAPAVRNFKVEFSEDDDADGEASVVVLRGRKSKRVRDGSEARFGKRSESAHALGGVCDRFKPDIGSASGLDMTPLDLGESAVRSSDDSDEEPKCFARGRSFKQDAGVNERGRSKKREGPAAERRSRSRHREFSR